MLSSKMNVLYLITCFKPTGGGHYYSLKTISDELSKVVDGYIVSIGPSTSNVFSGNKNYFALKTSWPSLKAIYQLSKIVKTKNINVVHSFDHTAYFFARIVSVLTGAGILHTKCGGPPPVRYHPKVQNLVLFSTEDVLYFNSSSRHRNANLYHIPNRVNTVNQDEDAIIQIKKRLRPSAKIILRIARFSEHHKKSIFDSIELLRRLLRDGFDVQLILIGTVQEQSVYNQVKCIINPDVVLLTEDIFTLNASRVLGVADIVVGTGRGAMEAAIQEKVLLSPAKNVPIPILVTRENADIFLDFNFSPRSLVAGTNEEIEYENIKNILNSRNNVKKYKKFIKNYSNEKFDIGSKIDFYFGIYKKCKKSEISFFDMALHFYLVFKRFFICRYFKIV